MASLETHFADYEAYHRTFGNKVTHVFGIPIIALTLLGLGAKVSLLRLTPALTLDLGILLIVTLVLTYLRWHAGLALGTGALLVPLYLVGAPIPGVWLWAILAGGVALQYAGHLLFERNSPAFHANAIHMLVGPLWVASLLLRHVGLYRPPKRLAPGMPCSIPSASHISSGSGAGTGTRS